MTGLVVQLDKAEMAVRLYEAMNEVKRPDDLSAVEALKTLSDDMQQLVLRAAVAAFHYFHEQSVVASPFAVDLVRPEDMQ
jgi:hypothetical protein